MKPEHILIITDCFADRVHIGGALEEDGYVVDEACGGYEGLPKDLVFASDLIILDSRLDRQMGLCRKLREQQGCETTPVIVLVPSGDLEAVSRGNKAGATEFIVWPARLPLLSRRVRSLLRSRRTARKFLLSRRPVTSIAKD